MSTSRLIGGGTNAVASPSSQSSPEASGRASAAPPGNLLAAASARREPPPASETGGELTNPDPAAGKVTPLLTGVCALDSERSLPIAPTAIGWAAEGCTVGVHWLAFSVWGLEPSEVQRRVARLLEVDPSAFALAVDSQGEPRRLQAYRRFAEVGEWGVKVAWENVSKDAREHVHVIIPGDACERLGTDRLLTALRQEFRTDSGVRRMSCSRLDVALDAPLERCPSVRDLRDLWLSEPQATRTRIHRGEEGLSSTYAEDHRPGGGRTLSLGSRESERFVRIYDRRGVLRHEVEHKGAAATVALGHLLFRAPERAKLLVGMVRETLDWTTPGDANASRRALAEWWAAIVREAERVRLLVPRIGDSLGRVRAWLFDQVGTILALVEGCQPGLSAELLEHGKDAITKRHRARAEAWFAEGVPRPQAERPILCALRGLGASNAA